MKKLFLLLGACCIFLVADAQKKGKTKGKKEPDKAKAVDYILQADPLPDTANRFIGTIKYRITTDDPAERDSMFIVFGNDSIRITMFFPGYKEGEIFEDNMIASFRDSIFYVLDKRNKTYKKERFQDRNDGVILSLSSFKKTGLILKYTCQELSGDMTTKDDERFEAAALVSKQHSYIGAMDYSFMNIQPVVIGYKIVLGWRTKSPENENTYIVAYKIEPGNTGGQFDLSGYRAK